MATFQRARSAEQRAERRRAILDTAVAMLAEMPAGRLTLNELSRRAGLAKSNVLRYFESREEILLELLDAAVAAWLNEVATGLDGDGAGTAERATRLSSALAASLAARPMLCDLISAQAAVLEHNVSLPVVLRHRHRLTHHVAALARLIRRHLPELAAPDADWLAGTIVMVTGSLWAHANPSGAVRAAYEADASIAALRIDFADRLQATLSVLIAGLLTRRG
ncbi:TetR/AcrR family transcriptional regulator [Actinoallomurus oryzae]|uniref:TetR/AcrR family transcriptional regulator n=1 Tax=Actinoallomurus oryzae TaxID=502180 RepID=A0ABP8QI08_9ACTN